MGCEPIVKNIYYKTGTNNGFETVKLKGLKMALDIIQKQLNKTYTAQNTTKTTKTTITIVGSYDWEKNEGDGLFIDSNRLLRDPTLVLHIARWAGYNVIDKTLDDEKKSQVDWSELKALNGDTPWTDLGRKEKIEIAEKKLAWMKERFDIEPGEEGKYLKGVKLTNTSLGHEGFMGEADVPGKMKSPANDDDFMTYLKKVYRGGGKTTVSYTE